MEDRPQTNPLRTKIAHILNRLLAGELSAEDAFALWPVEEEYLQDPVLREAYHTLQHYAADEDIRSRDTDYAQYQQEELREIARRLLSSPTGSNSFPESASAPSATPSRSI